MSIQLKIFAAIDIAMAIFYLQVFPMDESIKDFVFNEPVLVLVIAGFLIGGLGLLAKRKIGWTTHQLTGIHFIFSTIAGSLDLSANDVNSDDILLLFLVAVIGAGLLWTNKQTCINELKITNSYRAITISTGVTVSIVFLLMSYA